MKFKSIIIISEILENKIPEKFLLSLREFLLSESIFTEASEFLAGIIIFIIVTETVLVSILFIFDLSSFLLFLHFLIFPAVYTCVFVKHEKNVVEIEQSAQDFLRQLSLMLTVGLSFKNVMEDMFMVKDIFMRKCLNGLSPLL